MEKLKVASPKKLKKAKTKRKEKLEVLTAAAVTMADGEYIRFGQQDIRTRRLARRRRSPVRGPRPPPLWPRQRKRKRTKAPLVMTLYQKENEKRRTKRSRGK